jgi:RNA polymerase sigma-70 factor, ECF subfamily
MSEERALAVTTVLEQLRAGNREARQQLVALVYEELRQMAAGLMRRERPDHTLQPTALVNEAFVRLFNSDALQLAHNRAYFFGAAAQAMRQILVDHARQRAAAKRGGGQERVPLDDVLDQFEQQQRLDILDLEEALQELGRLNERHGQVVTLRFYGGLTVPEVAEQLGVSVGTVEGDFRKATAFLRGRLTGWR